MVAAEVVLSHSVLHLNAKLHLNVLYIGATSQVDPVTYARLKHLADRKSLPLKTVIREALRSYVDVEEGELTKDPLFRIVARLKLEGRTWSERKDWRP